MANLSKAATRADWAAELSDIITKMEASKKASPKEFYNVEDGGNVARAILRTLDGFRTRLNIVA